MKQRYIFFQLICLLSTVAVKFVHGSNHGLQQLRLDLIPSSSQEEYRQILERAGFFQRDAPGYSVVMTHMIGRRDFKALFETLILDPRFAEVDKFELARSAIKCRNDTAFISLLSIGRIASGLSEQQLEALKGICDEDTKHHDKLRVYYDTPEEREEWAEGADRLCYIDQELLKLREASAPTTNPGRCFCVVQ